MNKTVITKTGKYIGHTLESGIYEFLGIPYAKVVQRWKPAEELQPSDETFEAAECGPACWQETVPEEWEEIPPMSENCLSLNVWTADPDVKGKPVHVWIHGGCYMSGSNRKECFGGIYCGENYVAASPDIVYININYRVGIFGGIDLSKFDTTGEYEMSQNLQTLDQLAALKWIHENVEAFGGDPNQVTISGQSAGGMSVATLMAIPEANKYFQRVICQSTAMSDNFLKYREDSARQIESFFEIAGVNSLQELLDMSPEQLRDYSIDYFYSQGPGDPGPYEQIWDCGIFSKNPVEDIRKGVAKGIDLMIGTVAGEFDTAGLNMTDEELRECGMSVFPDRIDDAMMEQFISNYPERNRRMGYQDFWNDALLRMGAVTTADAAVQGGQNVYMYYMPFVPEGATIRPQHCFEIPYTNMKKDNLAYMDFKSNEPVQGNHPSAKLEKELHGCWSNFVRRGNPNGDHISVEWPKYNQENRTTAVVDHEWSIADGIRNKDTDLLLPLHIR